MIHVSQREVGAWLRVSSAGTPALALWDAQGMMRAGLGLHPDGTPALILRDAQQKARAWLGVTELETIRTGVTERRPESSLVLVDKDGKVLWKVP